MAARCTSQAAWKNKTMHRTAFDLLSHSHALVDNPMWHCRTTYPHPHLENDRFAWLPYNVNLHSLAPSYFLQLSWVLYYSSEAMQHLGSSSSFSLFAYMEWVVRAVTNLSEKSRTVFPFHYSIWLFLLARSLCRKHLYSKGTDYHQLFSLCKRISLSPPFLSLYAGFCIFHVFSSCCLTQMP